MSEESGNNAPPEKTNAVVVFEGGERHEQLLKEADQHDLSGRYYEARQAREAAHRANEGVIATLKAIEDEDLSEAAAANSLAMLEQQLISDKALAGKMMNERYESDLQTHVAVSYTERGIFTTRAPEMTKTFEDDFHANSDQRKTILYVQALADI